MGEYGTVADAATALRTIHCHAVRESINARGTNRVLGTPAPDVSEKEEQLPRKTRRILSQLRLGFSASLQDYKHRIGLFVSNLCPCCRQEEHSVQACSTYSSVQPILRIFNPWTSGFTPFWCPLLSHHHHLLFPLQTDAHNQ